jgi:YggT family protein
MLWLLLGFVLRGLQLLIVARVVISFVPAWQRSAWGGMVVALTEPLLAPFRGLTVRSGGVGLDFSPLVVLLIISVLGRMLRL